MSKQAKGFGLQDVDERGATFEMQDAPKESESKEEAIVLDIIGTDAVNLGPTAAEKLAGKKADKAKFVKAYQKLHKAFSFKRKVPLKEKAIFYELMATMLASGIPLIGAVRIFAEQTNHKYFKKIAEAISYQLEKGQSLSQAMNEYPHIFGESEIGIIESAEATGRLNDVLKRMSIQIEQNIAIKSKIRSAMIYPTIVIVFVIGAVYVMLRFVIPQITELFTQSGLELPALTQFLIGASDFVVNNGLLVFAMAAATAFALVGFGRTKPGKKLYHTIYLKTPVLKDFQKAIMQARFSRSIANLLNSGIGIVQACKITARSLPNVIYQNKVNLMAKDVSQGIPMAESMQDSPYFSNLLVSMFAVGERTAQIDDLASKTADYYEEKVSTMAENFSKLVQPFIVAIVGGLVAVVVLAIMLPMTELLGGIDAL